MRAGPLRREIHDGIGCQCIGGIGCDSPAELEATYISLHPVVVHLFLNILKEHRPFQSPSVHPEARTTASQTAYLVVTQGSQHLLPCNIGRCTRPGCTRPDDMALDLEEIDRSMSFHPSEATTISCGTVTIDPAEQKILLIWNKKLEIYQLPKGRKNIGEDMLSAALRETYEETGVQATPLRLNIATRATLPSPEHFDDEMPATDDATTPRPESQQADSQYRHHLTKGNLCANNPSGSSGSTGAPLACACEVTEGRLSTEFLGCCRYPDPQSSIPRTMKVVFYFAAIADSTAPRGPRPPKDVEKLDTSWVSASKAATMLRFKAEADIVKKALKDAIRSGYPMVA